MQPITVSTTDIPKPPGVVAGQWRVGYERNGSTEQQQLLDTLAAVSFSNVSNGEIVLFAERRNTSGGTIHRIERAYTVTDGEVIAVPAAILVGGS